MRIKIFKIDPEIFQNFYQPLPLEGEEVTAIDLNVLMQRDSYGMTRLHGAAYHGNTEAVEELLEKIRQNLTDPECSAFVN